MATKTEFITQGKALQDDIAAITAYLALPADKQKGFSVASTVPQDKPVISAVASGLLDDVNTDFTNALTTLLGTKQAEYDALTLD